MNSKPILFSAPMARAILDGSKTQTRRILKPQPDAVETHHWLSGPRAGKPYEIVRCYDPPKRFKPCNSGWSVDCPGPFRFAGKPGDQLWVKQTWRTIKAGDSIKPIDLHEVAPIYYEADEPTIASKLHAGRIRQSIFMRKWMSRITLQITDVRIQRLQEITHADAIAEGCRPHPDCPHQSCGNDYQNLWDQINGPGAWDANPYVAAYTFTRIKP